MSAKLEIINAMTEPAAWLERVHEQMGLGKALEALCVIKAAVTPTVRVTEKRIQRHDAEAEKARQDAIKRKERCKSTKLYETRMPTMCMVSQPVQRRLRAV